MKPLLLSRTPKAVQFYWAGDIEKYGTGFIRLRKWLSDYPNLNLNILDLKGFTRVELFDTDKVTDKVTDNQKIIIESIIRNNKITTIQLAEKIGISQRKVKDNINKLKAKGLLQRIGPPKGGYWKVLD